LGHEGAQYSDHDFTQDSPQPSEDSSEVIADSGEDGVGGIAVAAFEVAAAEVTFGLHVADHGLDCGSTSQFAFDGAEDAALLPRDKDAAWILRRVTTVSLHMGSFGSRDAIQSCMNNSPVAISVSKVRARFHDLVLSSPDQPHIRSPFVTAAPISRLRRARLGWTRPFCRTAFQAIGIRGSSTRIRQN